jgi:coenzyme F420-reducing hydrogenase delta subunit
MTMSAPVMSTEKPADPTKPFVPRILVFSTNNISDPGIDLAGSSHMSYSPGVVVISMPCTSGIRPSWIFHAIETGFDGVFIASDGDECAYLSDCSSRASGIIAAAQALLTAGGYTPSRLKMAAICSVCAEPFTRHVTQFSAALAAMGPASAKAAKATAATAANAASPLAMVPS